MEILLTFGVLVVFHYKRESHSIQKRVFCNDLSTCKICAIFKVKVTSPFVVVQFHP